MARKSKSDSGDQERPLPKLRLSRAEAREKLETQIAAGEKLLATQPVYTEHGVEDLRNEIQIWSQFSGTLLQTIFDNPRFYEEFSVFAGTITFGGSSLPQQWEDERRELRTFLTRLRSIVSRLPLIDELQPNLSDRRFERSEALSSNEVFIVHGHSEEVKQAVARFLERLHLRSIILHEQSSQSRTVIEKFEHHSNVGFAVVLLTPDDVGTSVSDPDNLKQRARQNVILEMGYFLGKLGRSKVAMLYSPGVELPSDLHGLLYIEYNNAGSWRFELAKEMRAAGLYVDMNLVL